MVFAYNASEGKKLLSQGITAEQKGENLTALDLYIQARTADKKNIEIKKHIDSVIEVIAKSSESIKTFNKKSSADLKKSIKFRGEWDKIRISLEKLFEQYTWEEILKEYLVVYYPEIQAEELTSSNYSTGTINLSVKAPFVYHITNAEYQEYVYEREFAKKIEAILETIDSDNEWKISLRTHRSGTHIKTYVDSHYDLVLLKENKSFIADEFLFKERVVFKNIPLTDANTDKITVAIQKSECFKSKTELKSLPFDKFKEKYDNSNDFIAAEEKIKNTPPGETIEIKLSGAFNEHFYSLSRLADAIRQCKGYVDLDISDTYLDYDLSTLGYSTIIYSSDVDIYSNKIEAKEIWNENGFKNCSHLIRIVLPKELKSMSYGAFIGCSLLREVVLQDELWCLGGGTFNGCQSLTEIFIPRSVSSLCHDYEYKCNGDYWSNHICIDSFYNSSIEKVYYEGSPSKWVGIETADKANVLKSFTYENQIEVVYDYPAWKFAEIKKAEKEHIAAEKKAEEERIAAAKKAEEERIATEKKAEEERIATEQEAENQRLKKFQDYYESGVVPAEDAANFLSTINFINNNLGEIKKIKIIGNVAGEMEKIRGKLHDRQLNLNPSKKDSYLKLALDFSEAEGLTELEDGYFWGWYLLSEITLPKTLIEIKSNAFNSCNPIINYTGSKKEWKKIKIDKEGNKTLLKAKINYDYKEK